MRRILLLVVVLALGLTFASPPAGAQHANNQIAVSAGAAMPTGDFGDQHDMGLVAALGWNFYARQMIVLQLAAAFHRFGISDVDAYSRALALYLTAMYALASTPMGAYVLASGGLYNLKAIFDDGFDTDAVNKAGFGAGLGYSFLLGSLYAFLELRAVAILSAIDVGNEEKMALFFPLTFGILFGRGNAP